MAYLVQGVGIPPHLPGLRGGGGGWDPIREGRPPFHRVSGFREWACFLGLGVHLL